jgi:hypothetical protein
MTRWTARVWALIIVAIILFMFIAHAVTDGIGPLVKLTLRESLMMAAFLITTISLALGWKWELVGGSLTLTGMAAFYIIDFVFSGTFPQGNFFLIIAFPGVLYLIAGLLNNKINTANTIGISNL